MEDRTIKIRHYVTPVCHGQCCILVLACPRFGVHSRRFLIPGFVQGSCVRRSTVDNIALGFIYERITYMMASPKLSEKYISFLAHRDSMPDLMCNRNEITYITKISHIFNQPFNAQFYKLLVVYTS
jgi:hypothetical protein